MTRGAILARMVREPSIKTEYLAHDNGGDDPADQVWTELRVKAKTYPSHETADKRADELGGCPIFAITCAGREENRPQPFGRPCTILPISGPALMAQEAIHRRSKSLRVKRSDFIAEELRAQDLAELEEHEVYD